MKLFELWATLGIDTNEFEKGSKQAQTTWGNLAKTISGGVSGALSAAGKTLIGFTGAAAAGFTAVTKKAVDLVGSLEQNLGGSKQVFGEYAAQLQSTAASAFSAMGLTQSEYLATANKMGSLFQGSGFEMQESMELTTQAMQRAADVASIMGIDTAWAMESIAGAAKGNFTMMDNLGVAMNATSIEAYALANGVKKSYNNMSQQEKIGWAMKMFLDKTAYATGNYARENETLAGSMATANAAFQNLLAGSGTVEDFVTSTENAARVLFRNLGKIVPRLGESFVEAAKQFAPKIEQAFAGLWDNELPGFLTNSANTVIGYVNDIFDTNLPKVGDIQLPTWEEVKTGAENWWNGIRSNFESLFSWTLKMFNEPAEGIEDAKKTISSWWTHKALPGILAVSKWTLGIFNVPIEDPDSVAAHLKGWWDLTQGAVEGVATWTLKLFGVPDEDINAIKALVSGWWDTEAVRGAAEQVLQWAMNLPGMPAVSAMVNEINAWWSQVKANVGNLTLSTAVKTAYTYTTNVKSTAKTTTSSLALQSFTSNPDSFVNVGSIFSSLGSALKSGSKSHATGLYNVPYDEYPAILHAGEAVLTRSQADDWREKQNRGSNSTSQDAREIARALREGRQVIVVKVGEKEMARTLAPLISENQSDEIERSLALGF